MGKISRKTWVRFRIFSEKFLGSGVYYSAARSLTS